jgi:hypothetical protein
MVSENEILPEEADASAAKEALLLSFRAFDLAISGAVQSGLPLCEWFRCALVRMAGKTQAAGENEIAVVEKPSVTFTGQPAPHLNQNTVSDTDAWNERKDNILEAAQNRIDDLCDALQGLLNISDTKKVTNLTEVKRAIARAKEALQRSRQVDESNPANCGQQKQAGEAA